MPPHLSALNGFMLLSGLSAAALSGQLGGSQERASGVERDEHRAGDLPTAAQGLVFPRGGAWAHPMAVARRGGDGGKAGHHAAAVR